MSDLKTETELLTEYLKPTDLTLKELVERTALSQITQAMKAYHLQFEKQANGADKSTEPALHKHIVSNNEVAVCDICENDKGLETYTLCHRCWDVANHH